jgi:RNA polymerase sigma-32 factor
MAALSLSPGGNLDAYIRAVGQFPLLTPDREEELALRFRTQNDLDAARELVLSHLRLVVSVSRQYRGYGLAQADLIQEGNIGLMMAVRKFNPHKGVRLISYAVWWIKAYIQNHIISSWSLLKIGTTQAQRKLFFKLRQAKSSLAGTDIEAEDAITAAESLRVSEQEFSEMEQRMQGDCSLNAEIPGSDGATALESLADDMLNHEELLSSLQENQSLQRKVAGVVSKLNEKEQYIIAQRITADDPMTLQEIASHFSISRERVRQIEEGALRKTRQALLPLLAA